MFARLKQMVKALDRDEQGADMVEYMLIFAAIALPLMFVIVWYWKDISNWAYGLWNNAKQETSSYTPGQGG